MNDMLVGAIVVAALVIGLYFLRFWKSTGDRFFLLFALAFWIEGADRLLLRFWPSPDETTPIAYAPRLVAYVLIIIAVVEKNRGRRKPPAQDAASGPDTMPGAR